jgi:hypothetical protein
VSVSRAFHIEMGAENLGIERLFEAIAHVSHMVVVYVHVELADIGKQEVKDRTVVVAVAAAAPLGMDTPR